MQSSACFGYFLLSFKSLDLRFPDRGVGGTISRSSGTRTARRSVVMMILYLQVLLLWYCHSNVDEVVRVCRYRLMEAPLKGLDAAVARSQVRRPIVNSGRSRTCVSETLRRCWCGWLLEFLPKLGQLMNAMFGERFWRRCFSRDHNALVNGVPNDDTRCSQLGRHDHGSLAGCCANVWRPFDVVWDAWIASAGDFPKATTAA